MPRAAITAPPGTPGAATIVIPRSRINLIINPHPGNTPLCIKKTAVEHDTRVIVLPDKWIVAHKGIAKLTTSSLIFSFLAHFRVTGIVEAEDCVPNAVK